MKAVRLLTNLPVPGGRSPDCSPDTQGPRTSPAQQPRHAVSRAPTAASAPICPQWPLLSLGHRLPCRVQLACVLLHVTDRAMALSPRGPCRVLSVLRASSLALQGWLPTFWPHNLRQEGKGVRSLQPCWLVEHGPWPAGPTRPLGDSWKWARRGRSLGTGHGGARRPYQWSCTASPRQEANLPFSPAWQYPHS